MVIDENVQKSSKSLMVILKAMYPDIVSKTGCSLSPAYILVWVAVVPALDVLSDLLKSHDGYTVVVKLESTKDILVLPANYIPQAVSQ